MEQGKAPTVIPSPPPHQLPNSLRGGQVAPAPLKPWVGASAGSRRCIPPPPYLSDRQATGKGGGGENPSLAHWPARGKIAPLQRLPPTPNLADPTWGGVSASLGVTGLGADYPAPCLSERGAAGEGAELGKDYLLALSLPKADSRAKEHVSSSQSDMGCQSAGFSSLHQCLARGG